MVKMVTHAEARTFEISKLNPLSANPTKWSNTLKQFVGNLPTNCLSVFDYFVILTLKRLNSFKVTASNPANIYLFKVNDKNTWKLCEICLRLIIKIPERRR